MLRWSISPTQRGIRRGEDGQSKIIHLGALAEKMCVAAGKQSRTSPCCSMTDQFRSRDQSALQALFARYTPCSAAPQASSRRRRSRSPRYVCRSHRRSHGSHIPHHGSVRTQGERWGLRGQWSSLPALVRSSHQGSIAYSRHRECGRSALAHVGLRHPRPAL